MSLLFRKNSQKSFFIRRPLSSPVSRPLHQHSKCRLLQTAKKSCNKRFFFSKRFPAPQGESVTNGTSFFVSFFYGKATGGLRFFFAAPVCNYFRHLLLHSFYIRSGFFFASWDAGIAKSRRKKYCFPSPPPSLPFFFFSLLFWENVPICHRRNSRFLAGFFFVLFSEKSMCRRRPSPYDVKGQ